MKIENEIKRLTAMLGGREIIDASDMVKSDNALERHIGERMDGISVDGRISAKIECQFLMKNLLSAKNFEGLEKVQKFYYEILCADEE